MTIKDKTVLLTGANRAIGQALAAQALARGAKRVYAGARSAGVSPWAAGDFGGDGLVRVHRGDAARAASMAAEYGAGSLKSRSPDFTPVILVRQ